MIYPGQRVQIDVKFVPASCLVGAAAGKKFYQYTAIDEFSRYRYLEAFEENSTYSSTQFLIHMLNHFKRLGFSVKCVQTDKGFEFTKRFGGSAPGNLSLFERALKERKIAGRGAAEALGKLKSFVGLYAFHGKAEPFEVIEHMDQELRRGISAVFFKSFKITIP